MTEEKHERLLLDLPKYGLTEAVFHLFFFFNLASYPATYGKTMIFDEDYPAVFASFLIRLNFDKTKIYPKYYWAFAQSENYIEQAARLMTGGGQLQFNGNAIIKIQIPVPIIEEQQTIVKAIEEEMQLVNANKRLIEIFEQKIKTKIGEVWGVKEEVETAI